MQILTGFLGSFAIGVLFNLRGQRLLFAAIGGLCSWALYCLLGLGIASSPIRFFIVSLLMSVYAEVLARILKTPTTTFIMTSLVPLIPGGSLYYTMAYALSGVWEDFAERALLTIQLAVALAVGIIVATAAAHIFSRVTAELKRRRGDRSC